MPTAKPKELERATVYLTPKNKHRLATLRRGEKTKTLNEALNHVFAEQERREAFKDFMASVQQITPVKPIVSSAEALRRIREDRFESPQQ